MSGKRKPGGYMWWATDYAADEHVRAMSFEQEGVYRACLDLQWLNGSIPADLGILARVLGKGMTAKRLTRLWAGILPCWEQRADRYVNRRLERERDDMLAFQAERSASGKKGNAQRWQSGRTAMAQESPPSPSPTPSPSEGQKLKTIRSRERNDELPGIERPRIVAQGPTHISGILSSLPEPTHGDAV